MLEFCSLFVFPFQVGIQMGFLTKPFTAKLANMRPFLLMYSFNMTSDSFVCIKAFFTQGTLDFNSSMKCFDMKLQG